MKTVKIIAKVTKETEKAFNVEITWRHIETEKTHAYSTWLPKSQSNIIENGIEIATWLADKIGNELRSNYGMCKNLGGAGIIYNI